jgi:1-deoxy-D-xylulose-5-phosphate synthase
MLSDLAERSRVIVTVEEGTIAGGFGSYVARFCADLTPNAPRVVSLGLPDDFVSHGPRAQQLSDCGLTPEAIVAAVRSSAGPIEIEVKEAGVNRLTEPR